IMFRQKDMLFVLLLAALLLGACQPVVAKPAVQQADEAAMAVMDQFFEAYKAYDMDKMLALQTDDVVWTWIDPGKNFWAPEGVRAGKGKEEIRAMFEEDRGAGGVTGYILWADVSGDTVTATELWESTFTHAIDVPMITHSTYKLRDGKIAEWVWSVSPESSKRVMNTADPLEANRQLMITINEEIWNQGNLDRIDETYAKDYVRHEAGYPAELAGAAGLKQFIETLRTGFPDWNCTVEDTLAEGDKVVVRYACSGTHTGEWNGLAPTGKPIQFQSMIIHRIADGKVAEDWSEYDSLGWMQQLGFELAMPQATSALPSPTVLAQGAQIRSPNGIKVGPDGNLRGQRERASDPGYRPRHRPNPQPFGSRSRH
ncbi:MAG: ester cyclase, partial [Caldilinea sp.]